MKYLYRLLHILCMFAPLAMFFNEFMQIELTAGEIQASTVIVKFSFIGMFLLLFVLVVTKKYWLDNFVRENEAIVANLKSALIIETDTDKLSNASKELKKRNFKLKILQAVSPTIALTLVYFVVFALEQAMVSLLRVSFIAIVAFVLAVVFDILAGNAKYKVKVADDEVES